MRLAPFVQSVVILMLALPLAAQEGEPLELPDGCVLPFSEIALQHEIDLECGADGDATISAHRAQNRAKNNYCAEGDPVRVTRFSLVRLQKAVEAAGIPFGSSNSLPPDRSDLLGLHTTSSGHTIGEGNLVRFAAFVLRAHHSNVSSGESVNCKFLGKESNDIHLVLAERLDAGDCDSITAEIPPHFRPPAWDPAFLTDLERPLRFTGQLFFDGSHRPCRGGVRSSPARISSWEIHPVYGIDVCVNSSLSSCRADRDEKWVPLHEWFALEEHHAEDALETLARGEAIPPAPEVRASRALPAAPEEILVRAQEVLGYLVLEAGWVRLDWQGAPAGFHVRVRIEPDRFVPESEILGEGEFCGQLSGLTMPGWLELSNGSFHGDHEGVVPRPPFVRGCQTADGRFRPETRTVVR